MVRAGSARVIKNARALAVLLRGPSSCDELRADGQYSMLMESSTLTHAMSDRFNWMKTSLIQTNGNSNCDHSGMLVDARQQMHSIVIMWTLS